VEVAAWLARVKGEGEVGVACHHGAEPLFRGTPCGLEVDDEFALVDAGVKDVGSGAVPLRTPVGTRPVEPVGVSRGFFGEPVALNALSVVQNPVGGSAQCLVGFDNRLCLNHTLCRHVGGGGHIGERGLALLAVQHLEGGETLRLHHAEQLPRGAGGGDGAIENVWHRDESVEGEPFICLVVGEKRAESIRLSLNNEFVQCPVWHGFVSSWEWTPDTLSDF